MSRQGGAAEGGSRAGRVRAVAGVHGQIEFNHRKTGRQQFSSKWTAYLALVTGGGKIFPQPCPC